MRSIYIIIIILIYIFYIVKKNIVSKENFDYNIIYNTGGYYGFYQLGVCHYIKNNFKYNDKSTLGISAGSWLSLFMNVDKSHTNKLPILRNLG